MKKTTILYAALAVFAFAGCSKNKAPQPAALQVTSSIHTRPANNLWEAGDAIGIYMLQQNETIEAGNYKYTTATSGSNAPFGPVTPDQTVYLPANGSMRDFVAYYPHTAIGSDNIYHVDVATQSSQKAIDLMGAAKVVGKSKKDASIAFVFKHKLVKLSISIQADDESLTDADLSGTTVKITNQQTAATYNVVAGGEVSVTNGASADILLKMNELQAEAVVLPNSTTQGMELIVTVPIFGGREFGWAVNSDETSQMFEAGKTYKYAVGIAKAGLKVTSSVEDWVPGNGESGENGGAELPKPIGSKSNLTTAAQGDFFFSDGSLEDKDATLTDKQKAACVGIVYWVGDPTDATKGDALLRRDFPRCTHGLVVALHNAGDELIWSGKSEEVNNWTNHADRGNDRVDILETNKAQGYANTVALNNYNTTSSNVVNDASFKVLPAELITTYAATHPTPEGSSKWYWPSILELEYIRLDQASGNSTLGRDKLNAQLEKAGGTKFDSKYWSSTEYNSHRVWYILFNGGSSTPHGDKRPEVSEVRPIFAF